MISGCLLSLSCIFVDRCGDGQLHCWWCIRTGYGWRECDSAGNRHHILGRTSTGKGCNWGRSQRGGTGRGWSSLQVICAACTFPNWVLLPVFFLEFDVAMETRLLHNYVKKLLQLCYYIIINKWLLIVICLTVFSISMKWPRKVYFVLMNSTKIQVKLKLILSLYVLWRNIGGVESWLYPLLMLTLDGGIWWASCLSCFTLWNEPPVLTE